MSANNDRDQSDIAANAPYPPSAPSQYPNPHPSYSYAPNEYPHLSDHDLAIAGQGYSQALPPNIAQLQDAAQNARASNGDGMRINNHGPAGMPGMGPPQPQGAQAFSPAGPRSSVGDAHNAGTPGDQKGKRGKASQACDECRRKKTKCITSTDESGVLLTCTSCAKNEMTCTYSRQPMKRGPNKGYIKDLADRVLQVESLIPDFRQSFDAGMFGTPGDDPMSARRNYSLPGGRTSFSGPDFGRDRLGSPTGFAPVAASTPRLRDRFSIAIPPDQPANLTDFYDEAEHRPAKRIKMDSEKLSTLPAIQVEAADLTKYYETIHPQFPLLPDSSETAIDVVSKATVDLQHAIVTAISLLPNTGATQETSNSQKSAIRDVKDMSTRLNNVHDDMILSAADGLVYVWTLGLLVVVNEYAVDTYDYGPLATESLVRKYLAVQDRLRDPKSPGSLLAEGKTQALDLQALQDMAARTRCMLLLQSKLALIATGTTSLPADKFHASDEDVAAAGDLSPNAKFLAYCSASFTWAVFLLHGNPGGDYEETLMECLMEYLNYAGLRTGISTTEGLFQHVKEFLMTILSRITKIPTSIGCLFPTAKLAEMLTNPSTTYSPVDIHAYTVCVLGFLEVLALPQKPNLEWAPPLALTGLNSLRPILQQKATEYATARSDADKVFWGTHEGRQIVKKNWAEALLAHVEACEAINYVNENTTKYVDSSFQNVAINFHQLINMGALHVLAHYAGRQVLAEMTGAEEDAAEAAEEATEEVAA